jgi:hypothetical protein
MGPLPGGPDNSQNSHMGHFKHHKNFWEMQIYLGF